MLLSEQSIDRFWRPSSENQFTKQATTFKLINLFYGQTILEKLQTRVSPKNFYVNFVPKALISNKIPSFLRTQVKKSFQNVFMLENLTIYSRLQYHYEIDNFDFSKASLNVKKYS